MSNTEVYNSSSVYNSRSVRFLYKAIFCHEIGFKEYVVFNKEVGKERFEQLDSKISSIMQPNLQMKMNFFEDEWKENITTEQWKKLAEIPEFDRKVVESIVKFTSPLAEQEKEDKTVDDLLSQLSEDSKQIVCNAMK